jgi:uncharacterized membrane protein (DUF4010 family)
MIVEGFVGSDFVVAVFDGAFDEFEQAVSASRKVSFAVSAIPLLRLIMSTFPVDAFTIRDSVRLSNHISARFEQNIAVDKRS